MTTEKRKTVQQGWYMTGDQAQRAFTREAERLEARDDMKEFEVPMTVETSDIDLMARFESERRVANGEPIGETDQTPAEAVAAEGWTLIRTIAGGTYCPGTPVLAQDGAGRLWVVNDLDGPWAILVAE